MVVGGDFYFSCHTTFEGEWINYDYYIITSQYIVLRTPDGHDTHTMCVIHIIISQYIVLLATDRLDTVNIIVA